MSPSFSKNEFPSVGATVEKRSHYWEATVCNFVVTKNNESFHFQNMNCLESMWNSTSFAVHLLEKQNKTEPNDWTMRSDKIVHNSLPTCISTTWRSADQRSDGTCHKELPGFTTHFNAANIKKMGLTQNTEEKLQPDNCWFHQKAKWYRYEWMTKAVNWWYLIALPGEMASFFLSRQHKPKHGLQLKNPTYTLATMSHLQ